MTSKLVIQVLLVLIVAMPVAGRQVAKGTSAGMEFVVEEVASGLGVPWGMVFLDANRLLVTERQGGLKIVDTDSGRLSSIDGIPQVLAEGQGGLLDVAVKGRYQEGDWIYFTYSKPVTGGGATTLARARLYGRQLGDWQDLLITRSVTDTTHHYGSRIAFSEYDHIFFTIGDRGWRPNGQKLSTHAGSVLRLYVDGKVPEDNPFVGGEGLSEIWSYGHRNPQGIAYDRATKRLWMIEHGPRGGDEINLIEKGQNYGWPVVSHGKEYWGPVAVGEATSKPGMADPVKVYIPSIAPGSLLVYDGEAFPAWQGNLFAGALKLQHLNRVVLDRDGRPVEEERLLGELDERLRALTQSYQGWLYFSTDSGRIMRVRPGGLAADDRQ